MCRTPSCHVSLRCFPDYSLVWQRGMRLLRADCGVVKCAVEDLPHGTHQFHFTNAVFPVEEAFEK